MQRVGIIVAMGKELEIIESELSHKQSIKFAGGEFILGEIGGCEVVVAQSGIGKVCSALCAAEMINRFSVRGVINTGVAGGLDRSLRVMDVVVGRESLYNDAWCGDGNQWGQIQGLPPRFVADERLYEIALSTELEGIKIHGGVICSGDKFITSRQELDQIKAQIPEVLATDMESNSIAQVCHIYQTPFISIRIISDTPGSEEVEEHATQYENFWGEVPKKSFEVIKQILGKLK